MALVPGLRASQFPSRGNSIGSNDPAFSPDGHTVSSWCPRDGRYDPGYLSEIYIVPASSGQGRLVTHAIDRNLYASEWMPDGKSLLVAGHDRTTVGLWPRRPRWRVPLVPAVSDERYSVSSPQCALRPNRALRSGTSPLDGVD